MRANTVHQYSKIFHSPATNYTILIRNHDKHILCQNISDKKVIELPITAVLEDENSSYVWVLKDVHNGIAKIKRHNIKPIDINNDNMVVEGLCRNDLVVTKGVSEIMDGQRVKVKDAE